MLALDLAVTGSFLGFCTLFGRRIFRTLYTELKAYRQNILDEFQQCHQNLKIAQQELDQARQAFDSAEARIEDMAALALEEISFIYAKADSELKARHMHQKNALDGQMKALNLEFQGQVQMRIWQEMELGLKNRLQKAPSLTHIHFIQKRL